MKKLFQTIGFTLLGLLIVGALGAGIGGITLGLGYGIPVLWRLISPYGDVILMGLAILIGLSGLLWGMYGVGRMFWQEEIEPRLANRDGF